MIRLSGVSGETSSRRRSDDHAHQVPALVDDVEIEDHLDVAVGLELGDGLAHRHVFAQREDMRVHDAAGCLLVVLEQVLDDARLLRAHQVEDRRRQLLRQVVDQRRGVVGGNLLRELGDLFGRAGGEQRRARLRTELGDGLHRQPAVALGEQAEGRLAILVGQLAEDLGEVGGMLLLQQVQQVGGRTNAQQSLDRVEDEIDSALRRHGEGSSVTVKQLNVARNAAV